MRGDFAQKGREELRAALRENRTLIWVVAGLSLFANLLLMTGPIYMMQVYDSVLGSGSIETLVGLSLLVLFLYTVMGVLDFGRARIFNRVGLRFYAALEHRVFHAVLRKAAVLPTGRTQGALHDLSAVRQFFGSPAPLAGFDLPWTPVFLGVMFLFHPLLGTAALAGAGVLLTLTVLNRSRSNQHLQAEAEAAQNAQYFADMLHDNADFVRGSGMPKAAFLRWQAHQGPALAHQYAAGDIGGGFSVATKTFRMFLQSAMLGLGAWLVIAGHMTPGGMIAGSVLLGRALSPIETLLNQWAQVQNTLQCWGRLAELLGEVPEEAPRTDLPSPQAKLDVKGITVVPPGERQATLKSISFDVQPGEALGVIGPSGAGKSSLARALAGLWPAVGGAIRLDGATLDQYKPEDLGQHVGYLPQQVTLFDGTIAENIARLAVPPDDAKVVAAAQLAGAHDMILKLPQGYDTPVRAAHMRLSGGQLQRIGLARAVYDDPVVVILDEPNSNLDSAGSAALNGAIKALKARDCAVLIIAHRPAAIRECDKLLVLENGTRSAFGPRDEVLRGLSDKAKPAPQSSPEVIVPS